MATARHMARQLHRDLIRAGQPNLAKLVRRCRRGAHPFEFATGNINLDDAETIIDIAAQRWPGWVLRLQDVDESEADEYRAYLASWGTTTPLPTPAVCR